MILKEKIEQFRKMQNSGELYNCMDDDFINYQHELVQKIYEYNLTREIPELYRKLKNMQIQRLVQYQLRPRYTRRRFSRRF